MAVSKLPTSGPECCRRGTSLSMMKDWARTHCVVVAGSTYWRTIYRREYYRSLEGLGSGHEEVLHEELIRCMVIGIFFSRPCTTQFSQYTSGRLELHLYTDLI